MAYANAGVCANADIDLVDYSNIDVGIALKMTGNFVLAAKVFNVFEIFRNWLIPNDVCMYVVAI